MVDKLRTYQLHPLAWLAISVGVLASLFLGGAAVGYVLRLAAVWLVTP